MKKNWYVLYALEALACGILFCMFQPGEGNLISLTAQPLILLGRGLRSLSLGGGAGNFLAWAVYLTLCLMPLAVLVWRAASHRCRRYDWLLALLSGAAAWGLYYLVNPTHLPGPWAGTNMGAILCSEAIWAVLLGYVLLRLLCWSRTPDRAQRLLGVLLNVLAAVLVVNAFGLELGRLLEKMRQVREANTVGSLTLTNAVLTLRYLLKALVCCLDLWMLRAGLELLRELGRDPWSEEAVEACRELSHRCIRSLEAVVLGSLTVNLLQIALIGSLRDVELNLNLPLASLMLVFAGILLCRLLQGAKELKDDSDLII